MALGRKKVTLPDDPAEEPQVEDVPDDEVSEPAAPVAFLETEDPGAAALPLEDEPADEPAASGDSLLDMFTTVGIHEVDRSLLVGLAGEVDMDDLISELGVVAAALGIVMSERSSANQIEELPAAA